MSLVDPQFTLAQQVTGTILRPFEGFEQVYQGQDGTIPIVFPGTLDEDAGKEGFSPYLLRGISCPLGAKAMFWLPAVTEAITIETTDFSIDYGYVLHWRMRNTGDANRDVIAGRSQIRGFHLSEQGVGAEDSLLAPNGPTPQFLLPSATETILFQQPEPTSAIGPSTPGAGVANLRTQGIAVPSDGSEGGASNGLPFLPPGAAPNFANDYPVGSGNTSPLGLFEQGVADPSLFEQAPFSVFRPYFTICKGDELMIACARRPFLGATQPIPPWDFNAPGTGLGTDKQFSNIYGINAAGPQHKPFKNLGIYAFFGSNPS